LNPLEEIIKLREKKPELGGRIFAVLKLLVVFASISSLLLPHGNEIAASALFLASVMLISAGGLRVLASGIILFSATIIPIDALSLAFGGSLEKVISASLYTLSTMISLMLFASTTTNEDFEKMFKSRIFAYAYSSIFFFMNSFRSIADSFESRGYEAIMKKPWSYVPLLISYIFSLLEKMEKLEESIEARGGE